MRKFKLIETYPDSPGLGFVGEFTTDCAELIYKSTEKLTWSITLDECLVYPKLWKEITPEYEILSFKEYAPANPPIPLGFIYRVYNGNIGPFSNTSTVTEWINGKNNDIYQIHSIKRLSDNCVFTVGDKIQIGGEVRTLEAFKIIDQILYIYTNNSKDMWGHINDWKIATPLFTTEDGVDIFEGDKYIGYNPKSDCIWPSICNERTQLNKRILTFSTIELAENYRDLHKLCFSKRQIKDVLDSVHPGSFQQFVIKKR